MLRVLKNTHVADAKIQHILKILLQQATYVSDLHSDSNCLQSTFCGFFGGKYSLLKNCSNIQILKHLIQKQRNKRLGHKQDHNALPT